jgi:hypothetical protein
MTTYDEWGEPIPELRRRRGQRGFGKESLVLLEKAVEILEQTAPHTVRGVAYQLFINYGLIPSMEKKHVDRVGRVLGIAREEGMVPWEYIEDESRKIEYVPSWEDAEEFARVVGRSYRRDMWAHTGYHVQVWSEKHTVGGILRPVLDEFGVPFLAVHGFNSKTLMKKAAAISTVDSRQMVILYVGDYDPSGMYMSEEDLPSRFARYQGNIYLERIALIKEDLADLPSYDVSQIREGKQKGNPCFPWYRQHYGTRGWELDAMNPNELRERLRQKIRAYIDPQEWDRQRLIEAAEQETIRKVAAAMGR